LELLQQFYIQFVDHSNHFCIFVGVRHKYCLHCVRCHCAITRPDYIQCILEMAPAAMLSHLEIASDVEGFHHGPIVLPCPESMDYSWTFFEQSIKETYDMPHSSFLPCKAITNNGMLSFCEAMKVDLQSWYNSQKKIRNKTHESSITSTISLVSCLFEDLMNLALAIQAGFIHSTAEMKERPITEANTVIWNKRKSKEKKHFICEPEGYNPSSQISRDHLEQLRLYKAWCAFCHNEYTKNLLCVVEEMSRQIYGPNATISNRCLGAIDKGCRPS
jgi:hypothetical protein